MRGGEGFVAFDPSKTKHAVAIADDSRDEDVLFLSAISPLRWR
jgi:hypothetical protein